MKIWRATLACFLLATSTALAAVAATEPAPPTWIDGHWVDNLSPFIIKFPASWPLEGIRWYGLAYVAGFIIAAWLMSKYAQHGRLPLNADQRSTFLTALILGVLIGGRLGYCLFYRPGEFFHNPLIFFTVWKGGMASHGGFLGGTLALWWFARHSKLGFLRTIDVVATLTPPGLLFGRLANFINGELWGNTSNVSWAIIFPLKDLIPRHPSQLYEAALEGLFLTFYTQWRWWKNPPPGQPGSLRPGRLAGETIVLYAFVRIFCELFREPDDPSEISPILGLSRGTFYSLIMLTLGLIVVAFSRRAKNTPAKI